MGKCFNCGKEINLKEGELNCPSCGLPPYNCWNCGFYISGETKECAVCKYFVCPSCDECGPECRIGHLINETKDMPIRKKIEYIYNSVQAPDRMNCPKEVPISYGHGKLKGMTLKLKGIGTKNKEDVAAFEKRFEYILDFPIEKTWTISQEKEDGHYGIELREVSNLAICMGKAKKENVIERNSEGIITKQYEKFKRIEDGMCKYANWENLISMYCYKCKKTYSTETDYCPIGCTYSKGKDKGQPVKLKVRKSKVHFCQLNRKGFHKTGEINNG